MRGARFAARSPIVDAFADQPIEAVDFEPAPADAGCENEGSCPQDLAPIQEDFARYWIDTTDGTGDEDFGSKPFRLLQCAIGKLVAGNPRWEIRDNSLSVKTCRPVHRELRARR